MRVYLITTDEPFYLPPMVSDILSSNARQHICGVGLLQPQGKRGWIPLLRQFYELYDPWTFFRVGVGFMIRKLAQRLPRRFVPKRFWSISQVAAEFSVPLHSIHDINAETWIEFFARENVDLSISLSASQVFRERIRKLPKFGTINVHAAPLPRYRGLMPSFWQLYHGETEGAVTVHWMEKELDSGRIILQRSFPILQTDTQHSVIQRGKRLGAELVECAIELIDRGGAGIPTADNDSAEATYFSFPNREQARRFRAMGRRFL